MSEPDRSPVASSRRRISTRAFTIGAIAIALLLACIVSIWASALPDGLTYVAASTGIDAGEQPHAVSSSPFADYGFVLASNPWLSLAIAGAVGCAVTFGLAWLVGRLAKRRTAED